MLSSIILYLTAFVVLALPVGNAICYIAFLEDDLPDEHEESIFEALFEPFRLILLGDKWIVYKVYV
jgi:hypothetical protein